MDVPFIVQQCVQKLVPASLFSDIASFCLVPEYPDWDKRPDIVVTTNRGELIEILNREPLECCLLDTTPGAKHELRIHFHEAEALETPTYIVKADDKLFIVGRRKDEDLRIIVKYDDITKFDLKDTNLSGEAKLCIWCHDDAMPVVLNQNYEADADTFGCEQEKDGGEEKFMSIMLEKMSEIRLNTAHNMKTLEERRQLRQRLTYMAAEDFRYDLDAAVKDMKEPVFDKIAVGTVWQKVCNRKWIIGIPIENLSSIIIPDIEILLNCQEISIFNYTVEGYERKEAPFFWTRLPAEWKLEAQNHFTAIVILELPKFENSSAINVKGTIKYVYGEDTFYMPLPDIHLKAIDIINGSIDCIMCNDDVFGIHDILALHATSAMKQLDLYQISETKVDLVTLLKENLGFSHNVQKFPNIIRHSKSPLHVLHGVLIHVDKNSEEKNYCMNKISVLHSSENQLLMLINIMYDLLSKRIVVVPSGYYVEWKDTDKFTEETLFSEESNHEDEKITRYGSVLREQMTLVSDHLEKCIDVMSECQIVDDNPKNKTTMNIDVLALGEEVYKKFWNDLNALGKCGNDILKELLD